MLDWIANLGVGLKVRAIVLCIGVLPTIALWVIIDKVALSTLQIWLALCAAAAVLLYYPTVLILEEFLVLRMVRRINVYVEAIKNGDRPPDFSLPPEKGHEHDFLRLKRNIYWMVQGLKKREEQLQASLVKVEEMSRRDELTNIWNRRYFYELCQREFARANREDTNISLIYFDLDDFKRINDTHGHEVGDRTLVELAKTVGDQLRELDVFGRLGGEEFAILLPGNEKEEALCLAERLRAAIESHAIGIRNGSIRCTASFGVAATKGGRMDLEELIKRADKAMYSSKAQGKNVALAE